MSALDQNPPSDAAQPQCPLCGSNALAPIDSTAGGVMISCRRCGEELAPEQLVTEATRQTRIAYNRSNGLPDAYGSMWVA